MSAITNEIVYEDLPSIQKFGIREKAMTKYFVMNTPMLGIIADRYFEKYSDQKLFYNAKIRGFPYLELGDKVRLLSEKYRIDRECQVKRIEHNIKLPNFTTSLLLEDVMKATEGWFTLDFSTLDGPDVLSR